MELALGGSTIDVFFRVFRVLHFRLVFRWLACSGIWVALFVQSIWAIQQENPGQQKLLDRVDIRQGLTESTKVGLWNPLKTMTLEGQVLSFDSKNVIIQVTAADGTSSRRTLSNDQVQRITPAWQGAELAATMRLFDDRKIAEFSKAYGKLDYKNVPDWQARLILVRIVQSREAGNQIALAAESFIRLSSDGNIPDFLYADMPLCWATSASDEVVSKAKGWINQDSEVARLLGASWLLLGPESKAAKTTLDELQNSKVPVIAQLAKAQSWRLVQAPETMSQLSSWLAERDRMLLPVSLGPTEFLTDRLMRIGQVDLALGCAFRIASLHADKPLRVRRALLSANQMLKKLGREDEAQKVAVWMQNFEVVN